MLNDTDFELLNAEIDGTLSPGDRAELSRRLLESPELRRVRDDLRRACAELDRMPPVEPPAGLREKILAALPPAASAEPQARRGFAFAPRTLRFAAAIVGGVLVSAVAFQASRGLVGPGEEQVVGTIADPASVGETAGDRLRIDASQVTGSVEFAPGADGLGVRFTPDAGQPGTALDPEQIEVYVERGASVTRLQPLAAVQHRNALAASLPGAVTPGEAVRVRVLAAGVPVFEGRWQAPTTH